MFYQLTYRIQDSSNNFSLELNERLKQLDYNYVQQLSWTSGHFILDSYDNNLIRILIAYPHIIKPDQELIIVQEYLLDRIGINYENINLVKWIQNRVDDIQDEDNLQPNDLIIRRYHQDYFFKRILEIALKENSPRIASVFYSNYYLDSRNIPYLSTESKYFNEIQNYVETLSQRFKMAYVRLESNLLPIFIINEPDKIKYEYLKELLISQIRKDFQLELGSVIYTSIAQTSLLTELEIIRTPQFLNNILGQIWEISLDDKLISSQIMQSYVVDNLLPIILDIRLHALIIIRNSKLLNLSDSMSFGTYIDF